MKARELAANWIVGAFLLAIVYVLVRPRSKAAELVQSFSDAVIAMVRTATDL